MKGTRSVCAMRKSEIKISDELGEVNVWCRKMPEKGSIYCKEHKSQSKENLVDNKQQKQEECPNEVDVLKCNTTKDKCNVTKHKTAGICAAVYNCGIIAGITELFGSESLTQVYMFLVWLVREMETFPYLLAYDDACHLKRFICNPLRAEKSEISRLLAKPRIVIDKMHFCNHVDKWCRRNVNPYTDEAFKDINTEACEQTFHFISKYKYATKHMSYARYNIFMLYICIMFNEDRLIRSSKKCRRD